MAGNGEPIVDRTETACKGSTGLWSRWSRTPLYMRIVLAVLLAILVGLLLRQWDIDQRWLRWLPRWDDSPWLTERLPGASILNWLNIPSKLVLRMLSALAPPLILLAVVRAIIETDLQGRSGWRLFAYLLTNTLVAICIGLLVANTLRPGKGSTLAPPQAAEAAVLKRDPFELMLENIPRSVLGPLSDEGKVIGVVILALLFGAALRRLRNEPRIQALKDLIEIGLRALIVVLHWIVDILPLAVFGIIAGLVGQRGFADFVALAWFVVAVLIALLLQTIYYLIRILLGSWAGPWHVLRGMRDSLVMAFSTASSTATMPVTYECLTKRVGLRDESASMGAMVGANFNNDGTALYEAMAALFVAQLIGLDLSWTDQLIVVVMSVIASVGAAGIPEAGLVTMTLVFNAVNLPPEYIPMLVAVDWFLDRCRTMVNVLGDVTVSCLLDGKDREVAVMQAENKLPS